MFRIWVAREVGTPRYTGKGFPPISPAMAPFVLPTWCRFARVSFE